MKNTMKLNIKKFFSIRNVIIYVIFFLFICLTYVGIWGKKVKVDIKVSHENKKELMLFYTNEHNLIYNNEMSVKSDSISDGNLVDIEFNIPSKDIEGLKIHFGYDTKPTEVKKITIKTLFKTINFDADEVKSMFNNVSPHIGTLEVKNKYLKIIPVDIDAYIYSNEIGSIIDKSNISIIKIAIIATITLAISIISILIYDYVTKVKDIKRENFWVIFVFIFILFMPNLFKLLGISDGENTEKRNTAYSFSDEKENTLVKAINKVENYYTNNFGLRNILIRLNSKIDLNIFGISPTDKVIIGKEGWLYYGLDGDKDLTNLYRGITRFTDEELEKIKSNLEEKDRWLESKGVPFVLMITPNKESIYPEYYSDKYKIVNKDTRMDQLIKYLNENSNINVIDLRDELIRKKGETRLYDVTDTHWNEYGAYYGYKILIENLSRYFPGMEPKPLEEFQVVKEISERGGDLANMMSVPMDYKEEKIMLKPREERLSVPYTEDIYGLVNGMDMRNVNSSLPRLLMFRDSFTVQLLPFISEHFSQSVYQWDPNMNVNLVNAVNPDVVVQQIVERNIEMLLEDNPQDMN